MEYTIRGLRVRFPFKAYECQLMFMERVIQALQEGTNALLESPTGTGKTLCLLCAALAWREAEQARLLQLDEGSTTWAPRIFYLSRTHSQLTKVISELRGSGYAPTTALLGARSQLCVNPAVKHLRGPRLNNACHALVTRRGCQYYEGVSAKKEDPTIVSAIMDIEELTAAGEAHKCCPYYLSRSLQLTADVVFMPYNYVLEPSARRTSKVELNGAILIFDEAHNLDSFCEDATSCTITSVDLRDALRDITPLLPRLARLPQETADNGRVATEFQSPASPTSEQVDVAAPDFAEACSALATVLRALESAIERAPLGVAQPGRSLFTVFSAAGLKFSNAARHISCLDAIGSVLQDPLPDERQATARAAAPQAPRAGAAAVGRLSEALKTIFVENLDEASAMTRADSFRMHVHIAPSPSSRPVDTKDRELAFWCMSAGVAMQELRRLDVRNILLASGTLSPLSHTAYEFQTQFPVRLENPHIVAPQQLWVGAMARGVTNVPLNSSFRNRDSVAYKRELGATLVNFCRMVPAGLLVFFPSYTLLTACVAFWKSPESAGGGAMAAVTVWDRVCKYKHAVVEPRENAQFAAALQEYRTRVTDPSRQGAVFFAVCRGKVAEGLDFADDMGRAVLVTGLPYPALGDDKVKVKRAYLDERAAVSNGAAAAGEKAVTGNDWYAAQAWKAVNQAVGRVIRHRWDYAAIVLLDERFCADERSFLSRWLQPYLRVHGQFAETSLSLARFFKEAPQRVAEAMAKAEADPQQHHTTIEIAAVPAATATLPPPAAAGPVPHNAPTALPGSALQAPAAAAPKPPMTEAERKAAELKATVDAFKRQAKASLSHAEYSRFQKALQRYRAREIQVPELMTILQPTFETAGEEKYISLMREFLRFLPLPDRQRYSSLIPPEEGVAEPSGAAIHPPPFRSAKKEEKDDSAAGKRRAYDLITGEATAAPSKAPRLERVASFEMRTAAPPPPTAAAPTNTSISASRAMPPPAAPVSFTSSRVASTPEKPALSPHVFSTPSPPSRAQVRYTSPVPNNSKFPPPLSDTPPPPPLQSASRPILRIAASPTALTPPPALVSPQLRSPPPAAAAAPTESPFKDTTGDTTDIHSPGEKEPPPRPAGKCPVCLDAVQDPCAARCGHVLCQPCWDKQLSNKLECPVCKQKVRKSQVKRIYFG